MIKALNKNITINSQELKTHSKASEKYVDVTFNTKYGIWSGWVPVEYRRTGVSLNTDDEISEYLLETYNIMDSLNPGDWQKSETRFWNEEKKGATVTRGFFDVLAQGGWKCREHELPSNPNFARRIQDLKEMGYTLATDTKKYCSHCKKNTTQLILLPIPRISIAGNGYETWSKSLRERILRVLNNFDVYEGKVGTHLLPDHKFSEIRWDSETKGENPDTMTDEEIRNKFQLMTNQRNQQKREACRICFQTRKRQYPFGIEYFYSGTENWDSNIPEKGQQAESGCIGCGWYDLNKWREEVINKLSE
ncbi:hypothetical protein NGA84_07350 [Lactococcus formosensis]|uniref:hypothetical protein n=1 Tax=Lactococcus formosensis TaxID=1281486 RepID=UPI002435A126|nr:hypothetical protein [Lactococcus formosensis]MDG6143160.1 hypothetical protein [Lactococcus formosensis]